jgi:hypothetical protein
MDSLQYSAIRLHKNMDTVGAILFSYDPASDEIHLHGVADANCIETDAYIRTHDYRPVKNGGEIQVCLDAPAGENCARRYRFRMTITGNGNQIAVEFGEED